MAAPGGARLLELGVVAIEGGRLVVRNPLLTDEVHRVVLDLEDLASAHPDSGDIVFSRENA